VLDMPAGLVRARAEVKNGKVQNVTFQNVPCFFYENRIISVPGLGKIPVDIAFGGNNYGIVNASDLRIGTTPAEIKANTVLVAKVIDSINEQTDIEHPEMPHIRGVLALLINDEPTHSEATCKNIYIDDCGGLDRSPCGTGTSARMAARFANGEQKIGDLFVSESVIGSMFRGRLIKETMVGSYKAAIPEITGRAYIIGLNQLVIDNDDPFGNGFVC